MIQDASMVHSSGLLSIGPKTERRFGRRNFMELFAVFSTPKTYTVVALAGHSVGSLSQDFVDRLVCDVSSFLLGGRPWAVMQINHDDRRVVVVPSPIGRQPTWGGFLPQFLGRELCQKILEVTRSTDVYPDLEAESLGVLREQRETLGRFLHPTRGGIDGDATELRWWTFAGGRINSTLRYALTALEPTWTVIPDNYAVKVRGASDSGAWLAETIDRFPAMTFGPTKPSGQPSTPRSATTDSPNSNPSCPTGSNARYYPITCSTLAEHGRGFLNQWCGRQS